MILLVDDDVDVRETSAEMLQDLGYDVVQAADGNEALGLLGQHDKVDVMVTDIRMPGISGLELSAIASRRFRDLKIILISGYFFPSRSSGGFCKSRFEPVTSLWRSGPNWRWRA